MSRTRRFLGGMSLGYVNQALVMLAGLWLTPFLLKHIGQHDYGLWLLGLQVLSYLMLMDFGIVALLPRETAYATGRAKGAHADDLPTIIGQTALVVVYQTPFLVLAVVVFWLAMPVAWRGFRGPIGLVMVAFTAMFPLRIFQGVLQGLQDLVFLGRAQILTWILSTATMIVLVLWGFRLYALAIGWSIGQAASTALCFYRLRSHFSDLLPSRLPRMPHSALSSRLTSGFWVSVAQVAQVLLNGTDLVIIGKLLGPSTVVPYSCTGKLISVLSNQPQILMQAAAPGLSEMKTSETHERLFQVSSALTQGMLLISGAVGCVVLAVNRGFVAWWVGSAQYSGFLLTVLLLANMLLRHWNTTAVYSIFCFGYERRISVTTLLDGIVTLGASLLLVRRFGLIGAPVGSILGVCLVSLPGNLSALARESEVSSLAVGRELWSWFWRFAIVSTGAGIMGQIWTPQTFIRIAAASLCVASLYVMVMLPMIMRSSLRRYFPSRVTRIWDAVARPSPVSDVAG